MSEAPRFFHVETQLPSGRWQTFTADPIEGHEAALKHLGVVQEFAKSKGHSPEMARLHELTAEDILRFTLTQKEKDEIVTRAINAMGPGEFWKRVAEARAQAGQRSEFERFLDEEFAKAAADDVISKMEASDVAVLEGKV